MTATRTRRPTFTVGAWQPDRTAPVLDSAGQEAGRIVQLFGWYDIDLHTPDGQLLRRPGGKQITKALERFSYFHQHEIGAGPAN